MLRLKAIRALALGILASGCAAGLAPAYIVEAPDPFSGPDKRAAIFVSLETVAEIAAKVERACPARMEAALQSLITATNDAPEWAGRPRVEVPKGSKVMTYLEKWAEMLAKTPNMPAKRVLWLGGDALTAGIDSHSRFAFMDMVRGRDGASPGLFVDPAPSGMVVRRVDAGSLPDSAGLRVRDRVVAIDGKSIALVHFEEAQGLLFGEQGTTVSLTVERNGETLDINLPRVVTDRTITGSLEGDVFVLTVPTLPEGAAKTVTALIEEARRKNPRIAGYVIDLRQNEGGLFSEVSGLADVFIEEGVLFRQAGLRGCNQPDPETTTHNAKAGDVTGGAPIVLVIGPNTASGAEMFAAAMTEGGRARSVGQHTAGSGRVQTVLPLGPRTRSAIKISTSEFTTAQGRYIEGEGVTPTIQIPPGEDALAHAIRLLGAK